MSMTLDQTAAGSAGVSKQATAPALKGVHHTAFRCRDAEETRRFYEDILGLPLKVSLGADTDPISGEPLRYMHLFFEFGDRSFIAFFDLPDSPDEASFEPRSFFDVHYAMEAQTRDEMMTFKQLLESHGVEVMGPVDHGFVESIYFRDPNSVNLEITWRTGRHDTIVEEEAAAAHDLIARWSRDTAAARTQRA